ncbi:transcription initiation factor IIB [Halomicrococcus gelatinilyticus]|uniref:transcription initiation factor IIB n=1 Tax=Halomicrococcus gelatinilyticus TaxID=1702103 RepID=UPI002E1027E5
MATNPVYERCFDEDESTENSAVCPECNGEVRTNKAETVCADCGLVIDEQRIDHGPEWRSFNDEPTSRKRTGAPLTAARHDRGLSTTIGHGTDANGNTLSGRKRKQLGRLRREQSRGRFQSKAERNLAHGMTEIRRLTSALELPKTTRDQACQLFRTAQDDYKFHYTDSNGVDLRWGSHPHADDYVNVSGLEHYHPPPNASSDPREVEDSCITQSPVTLVTRAVLTLWRAAYHSESFTPLNAGRNPP